MSLNRVCLVGRLCVDPEMKYTANGVAVARLRLAVNRNAKGEDGSYESDFFNVTAWRKTAEFASQYLAKGRLVSLDGCLQTRSWVDQATGQKRTAFEIIADNINGLDKKQDNGEGMPSETGEDAAPRQTRVVADKNTPVRIAVAAGAGTPAYAEDEADPFADEQ